MRQLFGAMLTGGLIATAAFADPSTSGVRGRVTTWPSCPAESNDQPCAPLPRAARLIFYRVSGQRVATVDVGENGRFDLDLVPGDYLIEAQAEGAMCTPAYVTVADERYVQVEIACDTGIR